MLIILIIALLFQLVLGEGNSDDYFRKWYEEYRISKRSVLKSLREDEYQYRYQIFKNNMIYVESQNKKGNSYTLGPTKFADMTPKEFESQYLSTKYTIKDINYKNILNANNNIQGVQNINDNEITLLQTHPSSINWVSKGAVNTPGDMGNCGSCYAFSSAAAVEALYYQKTNQLIKLSEQEIVDCSKEEGNNGCNGGNMDITFSYYLKNGKGCQSKDYLYVGNSDNICDKSKCNGKEIHFEPIFNKYKYVHGEIELEKAVAISPVALPINANFAQFYFGGIIGDPTLCNGDLNQAVTVVGYNNDDPDQKYWIVKNSLGPDWGEKGFVKLVKDVGLENGICGVATEGTVIYHEGGSTPTKSKSNVGVIVGIIFAVIIVITIAVGIFMYMRRSTHVQGERRLI